MSQDVMYTIEDALVWERRIRDLISSQIKTPCLMLFCVIISELYEYCAWYIHQFSSHKNIKLNDINNFCDTNGINRDYLKSWYALRNSTIHAPFSIEEDYITSIVNSDVFRELLYVCLKDLRIYDDILCNYSLWLNVWL